MMKWFQRSLMAVGIGFMVFIAGMIVAMGTIGEEAYTSGVGVAILLVTFLFGLIAIVSGFGAVIEWLRTRSSEKAKRGLVYEDEMLNRIMQRLSAEERNYLQGYLAAQAYEPVEEFQNLAEENEAQSYRR